MSLSSARNTQQLGIQLLPCSDGGGGSASPVRDYRCSKFKRIMRTSLGRLVFANEMDQSPKAPPRLPTTSSGLDVSTRPLIITSLEGVLADIFYASLWDKQPALYVRPGVLNGLQRLSKEFQVCLVSSLSKARLELLLRYFDIGGYQFDGVYACDETERSTKRQRQSYLKDYSAIYQDMNIPPVEVSKRVLILAPLHLSHDEIERRIGSNLVYSPRCPRPYFAPDTPFPLVECESPVMLLLPNPRAQTRSEAIAMSYVVQLVSELAATGGNNWLTGFQLLTHPVLKKVDTGCFLDSDLSPLGATSASHHFLVVRGAQVEGLLSYERVESCPQALQSFVEECDEEFPTKERKHRRRKPPKK